MARRRAHHAEEEHENHERWLLTYSDMITLLMVLFIVLFAVSTVNQKKFDAFGQGLAKAFGAQHSPVLGTSGVLNGGHQVSGTRNQNAALGVGLPSLPQLTPKLTLAHAAAASGSGGATATAATVSTSGGLSAVEAARLLAAERRIEAALVARNLQGSVAFHLEQRGLVVTILTDDVLFPTGQVTLQSHGLRILDAIAPVLSGLPNSIAIEGHTDNVPVTGGPYPSNWELSALRATAVLRYLVNRGVPPVRLSAAGYGDERPLVPNTTPANRARNRRVEIVVLSSSAQQAISPAGTSG